MRVGAKLYTALTDPLQSDGFVPPLVLVKRYSSYRRLLGGRVDGIGSTAGPHTLPSCGACRRHLATASLRHCDLSVRPGGPHETTSRREKGIHPRMPFNRRGRQARRQLPPYYSHANPPQAAAVRARTYTPIDPARSVVRLTDNTRLTLRERTTSRERQGYCRRAKSQAKEPV
jgi:hypothetical protein